jgi:hypothetical protein
VKYPRLIFCLENYYVKSNPQKSTKYLKARFWVKSKNIMLVKFQPLTNNKMNGQNWAIYSFGNVFQPLILIKTKKKLKSRSEGSKKMYNQSYFGCGFLIRHISNNLTIYIVKESVIKWEMVTILITFPLFIHDYTLND